MAEKAKGSILYKVLILFLAAVLVGSILYPKKLKEEEERNAGLCRHRMEEVQRVGLQYQKYTAVYNDTLDVLFNFIKASPQFEQYVDSVVVGGLDSIVTKLNEFRDRQHLVQENIPNATDSVMIDSLAQMQNDMKMDSRQLAAYVEYVHDRMRNLPNMPVERLKAALIIIDSKQFTLNMDIVRNSIVNGKLKDAEKACNDVIGVMDSNISQIKEVATRVPDYKGSNLEQLAFCPTTGRAFKLAHIDTSVIKYLNVYCPIDSADIATVAGNFMQSKIGGFAIETHGIIDGGVKSWEDQ